MEVVGGDGERFEDAFANGDGRHHDHELAPPVALVQLENGLDVAVGFSRARLHFDVEIHARGGGRLEGDRLRQILSTLDGLDVLEELVGGQREIGVLEAFFEHRMGDLRPLGGTWIDAVLQASGERLARETVGYGLHRPGLVLLDLELELHRGSSPIGLRSFLWLI